MPTVGLANSALGREPNGVRFGSVAWRLCMIGNLTSYLCRDYRLTPAGVDPKSEC